MTETDGGFGVDIFTAIPAKRPRRPEVGVQAACRGVLRALEGLEPGAQLRVLRAAALLLGPDEPAAAG